MQFVIMILPMISYIIGSNNFTCESSKATVSYGVSLAKHGSINHRCDAAVDLPECWRYSPRNAIDVAEVRLWNHCAPQLLPWIPPRINFYWTGRLSYLQENLVVLHHAKTFCHKRFLEYKRHILLLSFSHYFS